MFAHSAVSSVWFGKPCGGYCIGHMHFQYLRLAIAVQAVLWFCHTCFAKLCFVFQDCFNALSPNPNCLKFSHPPCHSFLSVNVQPSIRPLVGSTCTPQPVVCISSFVIDCPCCHRLPIRSMQVHLPASQGQHTCEVLAYSGIHLQVQHLLFVLHFNQPAIQM